MRKFFLLIILFTTIWAIQPAMSQKKNTKPAPPPAAEKVFKLNTYIDTVSYIIGTDIGYTLKNNGFALAADPLIKGLRDAMTGNDTMFGIEQAEAIIRNFTTELSEKRQKDQIPETSLTENTDGMAYLNENKTNPGVTETPSGLQYKVIRQGEGNNPKPTDKVTVHYRGTLVNGKVFDSSYDRGAPATFELGRLIPGWVEGIQLMNKGAKFMFFIPPKLGYGDRDLGDIPPNSMLIFEVELIDF